MVSDGKRGRGAGHVDRSCLPSLSKKIAQPQRVPRVDSEPLFLPSLSGGEAQNTIWALSRRVTPV